MLKKTKIISTLGPSCDSEMIIEKLYKKGTNVFRVNMSHTDQNTLGKYIKVIKKLNRSNLNSVGIMVDTQGPEIRTKGVSNPIPISPKDKIVLVKHRKKIESSKTFCIDNIEYLKGIKVGGKVSLDNGAIELKIKNISKDCIECESKDEGLVANRKHVNFPGARISLPSLTRKDKKDIKFGIEKGIHFIALSFCRTKKDLDELKRFLGKRVNKVEVFAKIEDQQGLKNAELIANASDGIMVARGDLGIETDITNLPYIQRNLIKTGAQFGKKTVVATQLLETMIESPHPSRAEVSDIANAVYEGADALMLSGETSIGKYPIECVKYLSDIVLNAEKSETLHFESNFRQKTDWHTLAATSVKLATKIDADAIVVLTRSGFTANIISRYKPKMPIYAFTNNRESQSKLSITSTVENIFLRFSKNHEATISQAFDLLRNKYKIKGKKKFVVISGVFSDIYADAIQIRNFI